MNELVENLVKVGVLRTPHIIEAFLAVDRKDFVLPEHHDLAYEDYPLPIGHGQTISQPYTVAFMFELLEPEPGHTILDVGSGSGWTSALLAHIVSDKKQKLNREGRVISIELIPKLADFGKRNVAKYNFIERGVVSYIVGSGAKGYSPGAPFDRILVSAAAQTLSQELIDQLKVDGVLVIPVQDTIVRLRKISPTQTDTQEFPGFAFVPLRND